MNLLLAALLLANTMVLYDRPSWTVGIDSRTTDQWLAEAPGAVFATSRGNLVAIDSDTGNVRWKSTLQAQGAPAVTRGTIVAFDNQTSQLCGFSARGERRWCRDLGLYYRDGTVFGLGGNLVAISSNAGWVFF